MTKERQELINLFLAKVFRYEEAIKYGKTESNKVKRFLYGFKMFGLSYLYYHLAKFRLVFFPKHIRTKFFFGKEMILPATDLNSSVFSMYGIAQDKSERKLALWLIKNTKEDDIFYDIGAHMGYYTALGEEIIVTGEIHIFEANTKLCGYLKKNFSNKKDVYITCAAVADAVGEVDFYDATKIEDSSASSRFPLSNRPIVPSKITATTIDDYVKKGKKSPTLIKFDIEGGEYDAILGALEVIIKNNPRIVMEIWGDEKGKKYSDKAVKKLQELGYVAFSIKKDGSLETDIVVDPVSSISGHNQSSRDNFLFLHK